VHCVASPLNIQYKIWFLKNNQLKSKSLRLVVLFYNSATDKQLTFPLVAWTLRLRRPCFNYINCLQQIIEQQSVQVLTQTPFWTSEHGHTIHFL